MFSTEKNGPSTRGLRTRLSRKKIAPINDTGKPSIKESGWRLKGRRNWPIS